MVTIEVDDEVFNYLKSQAEPFVDTPNIVLRRLLFQEDFHKSSGRTRKSAVSAPSATFSRGSEALTELFISSFLRDRYGERFRVKSPFRTMFESETHLIYFQNFNKSEAANLWYRLSESSLRTLREANKTAIVCFTNPSEGIAILVPINDIDKKVSISSWKKDYLEVNIDPADFRWRELDWNLEQYLVKIREGGRRDGQM